MRIQHNIMAMNAYRNYTSNTSALSKNLEKLSSGYKINRAGDDAAGLAISEKMRAQVTGLKTAQKNAKDGISLVQTAEGALTEVHSMLNRMVELADQSANGTYDDAVDRANLQKEFDALRTEIDRIADSSNFNGIKLLNGDLAKTAGVSVGTLTSTNAPAVTTGDMGTIAANPDEAVDGVLTPNQAEVKYSAKFYVGDIKNSNAADKDIVFTYKDNNGADKTITMTVEKGKTATTEDIVNAMKGTKSGGIKTIADNGTAISGSADGKFTDLYDVTSNGNVITITAKNAHGAVVNGGTIDSSKNGVGATVFDISAFDQADKDAAVEQIKKDFTGSGTASNIAYGSAAGEATAYKAAVKGNYQVASNTLTLDKTSDKLHNMGVKVGDKTYVIQNGNDDLKGLKGGEIIVKVGDGETAVNTAKALAAAITAQEGTNGNYVASVSNGKLTISESTNRAQDVLDGNKAAGKADDLVQFTSFTTTPASTTVSGELTLDADKLSNGTTVKVGDKTYMLTDDPTLAAGRGVTKVAFAEGSTSAQIATALANQLTADGVTGVGTNGAKVTFTGSTFSGGSDVSATGTGLSLQIGDTAENFNRLNVVVNDTHTAALGIDDTKINIDNQESATTAIEALKTAINSVSSTRGDLGATQNRLEHTINNLSVMQENIQDAEANIRDVDVAEEMMSYTKNNILVQSAQAMLAQANQVPQGVLQLLQ